MRKPVFILLSVALGISTAAQAQRRGHGGGSVSLGLKAGASLTTFTGTDTGGKYANRFGFVAGAFANVGLTSLFAFQPELLYSQKGAKAQTVDDYGQRLHYLDVPLAFHVNASGLFFELGPQVGFLLGARQYAGSASYDETSRYNTVDFGYLAGLGYQRKQGLGVGLRYNGGFTNVEKASVIGPLTIQTRQRNSAFQLYLTYSFQGR